MPASTSRFSEDEVSEFIVGVLLARWGVRSAKAVLSPGGDSGSGSFITGGEARERGIPGLFSESVGKYEERSDPSSSGVGMYSRANGDGSGETCLRRTLAAGDAGERPAGCSFPTPLDGASGFKLLSLLILCRSRMGQGSRELIVDNECLPLKLSIRC